MVDEFNVPLEKKEDPARFNGRLTVTVAVLACSLLWTGGGWWVEKEASKAEIEALGLCYSGLKAEVSEMRAEIGVLKSNSEFTQRGITRIEGMMERMIFDDPADPLASAGRAPIKRDLAIPFDSTAAEGIMFPVDRIKEANRDGRKVG